jgi:hypothetical protein
MDIRDVGTTASIRQLRGTRFICLAELEYRDIQFPNKSDKAIGGTFSLLASVAANGLDFASRRFLAGGHFFPALPVITTHLRS